MKKEEIKIIKNTPFGYKKSKEFFDNIVTPKFIKLQSVDSCENIFEKYYDYIFSAGALREWIINEFNFSYNRIKKIFWNDKFFNILHSIYNNTKHYTLAEGRCDYNIILDGKPLMPTDENGNSIWTDDFVWDDNAYWIDRIEGESGGFNYFCEIIETKTQNTEFIYLFEICKQVYNKYNDLIITLCDKN